MSISLFQWLRLKFEGGINLLAPSLPEFASQQEPIWTWPWSGLPAHICIVPEIFAYLFTFGCVSLNVFFSLHIFVYSSNVASQQEPIWSWPWYGLPVHICSVPNISHTFYIYMCFLIFCKYLYICQILHQELILSWPWYGLPAQHGTLQRWTKSSLWHHSVKGSLCSAMQ